MRKLMLVLSLLSMGAVSCKKEVAAPIVEVEAPVVVQPALPAKKASIQPKNNEAVQKPYVEVNSDKSEVTINENYLAKIYIKNYKGVSRSPRITVNGMDVVYDGMAKMAYFTSRDGTAGSKTRKGKAVIPVSSKRDTTIYFSINYNVLP